jgi:molybdenum cofactor biosynthesis protein B
MSDSAAASHRGDAPSRLRVAVLTISDTRTIETDTGGALVVERIETAGHAVVERAIVRDDPDSIRATLTSWRDRGDVDAALLTGGTGISARDRTFETVTGLLTTALPGYGELFRMLSYQEIGAAAMLSRAVGGLAGRLVVLTMPGSRAAVRLAMDRLIVPELPHLVREARRSD